MSDNKLSNLPAEQILSKNDTNSSIQSVYIKNFGCKVNTSENFYLQQKFINNSYGIASSEEQANIVIINTCFVTQSAKEKCVDYINKLRYNSNDVMIVATGCLAEGDYDSLSSAGADVIVSNGGKDDLFDAVVKKHNVKSTIFDKKELSSELPIVTIASDDVASNSKAKTRAFLKIQDGCNEFCSYCFIPFMRGLPRSKSINDVVSEFLAFLNLGYKEIVITGVHIGIYGVDLQDKSESANLTELLKALVNVDFKGDFRIRLSSLYSYEVTDELLQTMSLYKDKVAPHLHIPLQSGSDVILDKMNRRYTGQDFIDVSHKAKSIVNGLTVGTDVIVGFPSETDVDFQASLDVIRKSGVDFVHVFSYSEHEKTKAVKIVPKVDAQTIKERSKIMHSDADIIVKDRLESYIGRTVRVLAERSRSGVVNRGLSDEYIEVDLSSETSENLAKLKRGEFYNVKLTAYMNGRRMIGIIA